MLLSQYLHTLSAKKLFLVFVGISFILTLAINSILIIPSIDKSFVQSQQYTNEAEFNTAKKLIEQYVKDRIHPIRDLAELPIIVNGVMQTDVSEQDLADFLKDYRVQGEKIYLALLNFIGGKIIEKNVTYDFKYDEKMPWFQRLINGETEYEVNLIRQNEKSYLQIAAPVSYNQSIEGIMVGAIPIDLTNIYSALLRSDSYAIGIIKNNVLISSHSKDAFNDLLATNVNLEGKIDSLGIYFIYIIDRYFLDKQKYSILINLLTSLLISLSLAYIAVYFFGRQMLLNPYQKLQESENTLKVYSQELEQQKLQLEKEKEKANLAYTDAELAKEEVERQLRIDPLTGLSNRKVLEEISATLGLRRREKDKLVSFALVDLNKFKPINDTFGHAAGDLVLISVAERLKASVKPEDTVIRLGGDEFGIVMTNIHSNVELKTLAENILTAFKKPVEYENKQITIGACIGLAYGPDTHGSFEELISSADQAMYSIKSNNELAYAVYDPNATQSKPDLNVFNEFQKALTHGQIISHYQPKVDLKTGNIIGFEALARWEHPERGILPPKDFFYLIDEYGLQNLFNAKIIRNVLRQLEDWKNRGLNALPVSINVDEQILATENGLASLEMLFNQYSNVLDLIVIEITEDVFVARAANAIKQAIERLKELGIKISMDDFGTGYGSFKHLQEFPFDELKIDMQFTKGIGKDRSSEVIIDGFLSIAEGLNASVVAEGIESQEQVDYLKERGCQQGQGYLYGKAMPEEEVASLLGAKSVKHCIAQDLI